MTKVICVAVIVGGLRGLLEAIDLIRNPPKSSAVRRAEREDCRSKGL